MLANHVPRGSAARCARLWARSAGSHLRNAESCNDHGRMDEFRRFFRANPQVLVFLVICLVLGLGTFLIVIFGLISSSPGTNTGEPSGSLTPILAALRGAVALLPS